MEREKYNNFCDVNSVNRKTFLLLRMCVKPGGKKSLKTHIDLIEKRKINTSVAVRKLKSVHTVKYRTVCDNKSFYSSCDEKKKQLFFM